MPNPDTSTALSAGTMWLVLVRSCTTSKGPFVAEIQGGTKDSDPLEFPIAEAQDLINLGVARIPPPYLIETLTQEK